MEYLEKLLNILEVFWQKFYELSTHIILNANWGAIQSVAILAAVIVAVLSILKNEKRKKAVARNIRARLLAEITILKPLIERGLDAQSTFNSSDLLRLREHITIIKEIFPQAHVLNAKEHDILAALIINLAALHEFGPKSSEGINEIMHLLNLALQQFEGKRGVQGPKRPNFAGPSQGLEEKGAKEVNEEKTESHAEPKVE
jgi:hypothetical protein